jgi:hypothetical protein
VGETPDHIREDIEETRARMDETDAGADSLLSRVTGTLPDGEGLKSGARKVGVSRQNPLGLAIAGAAAGFVVGTLLPSTTTEDERLGEISDQVGDKAREAGQEALDRTKDVAREAVDSARQTVEERTDTEAEQMASSLRDKAQEVGSSSTS